MNTTDVIDNSEEKKFYIYGTSNGVPKKLYKVSQRSDGEIQIMPYSAKRYGFTEDGELIKDMHYSVHLKKDRDSGVIKYTVETTTKSQTRNYTNCIESDENLFSLVMGKRFAKLSNPKHDFDNLPAERDIKLTEVDLDKYTLTAGMFVSARNSNFAEETELVSIKTILTKSFRIVIGYFTSILLPVPFSHCWHQFTVPEGNFKGEFTAKECLEMFEYNALNCSNEQYNWIFLKVKTPAEMECFPDWKDSDFKALDDKYRVYCEKAGTIKFPPPDKK